LRGDTVRNDRSFSSSHHKMVSRRVCLEVVLKAIWTMGYRKTIESPRALPEDSATRKCLGAKGKLNCIVETAATGALWFPAISERSLKNVILREEAMTLGRFGTITLLTLHTGKFPDEVIANRNAELGY